MRAFVDQHRGLHGVEPICRVLQIAPSGYRRHAARQRAPELRSQRAQRDEAVLPHIERVWPKPTCRSTAPRRSGGSCTGKAMPWHAAPSSG
jgi:hypothetical protein